jgi:hypothetical protein
MDQPVPEPEAAPPEPILCPTCAQPVAVDLTPGQRLMHCPRCDNDFFLPDVEEVDSEVDWQEPTKPSADADAELDGLRIRKLVMIRRSAIRARTYAILVTICSLVMGVQLILTCLQEEHDYGWDRWAILYAFSAAAVAIIATIASAKATALHKEAQKPAGTEPVEPPSFEELSDGSQRVKNLEEMTGEENEQRATSNEQRAINSGKPGASLFGLAARRSLFVVRCSLFVARSSPTPPPPAEHVPGSASSDPRN